jgi:hypothetical protein
MTDGNGRYDQQAKPIFDLQSSTSVQKFDFRFSSVTSVQSSTSVTSVQSPIFDLQSSTSVQNYRNRAVVYKGGSW